MNSVKIQTKNENIIELDEAVLVDLDSQLRGRLLKNGDEGYDEARKVWNGMIDRRPALILQALGPADVITAVNFVRKYQLKSSIRAGGHNVSGAAIADQGLVIDVSRMRSVHVNPEEKTAVVEGGALLGDLDHETEPFGLAAPIGVVSLTGVAGLTLHGGIGWLTRKYGLSIDNLKSIELVTPKGELIRASDDNYADLFWALRGGGGNFGVVTAFEFNLQPVKSPVSAMVTVYPLEESERVMRFAREYMASAPEDLMLIALYGRVPAKPGIAEKDHGRPALIFLGCYSGPLEQAEEITSPLRTVVEPIADLNPALGWKEMQQLIDENNPEGELYYWKSIYLDRINDEVFDLLKKNSLKQPSPDTTITIWFLGGFTGRVPAEATAFFNRQHPYMIGIQAKWKDNADSDANIFWARSLYSELEKLSDGGSYLNFPGNLEKRELMLKAVYGDNLERLKKVKAKYDPDNIMPGLLNIS